MCVYYEDVHSGFHLDYPSVPANCMGGRREREGEVGREVGRERGWG